MASRISHILTSPFRRKHSDVLVNDLDIEKPEEDVGPITKSTHSSQQELNAHKVENNEIKSNFGTEWTRCSCCLEELHDVINCMPTTPKHRICSNCQGYLCKNCKVKGICHECIISHEVKIEPEALMELDENKLREYVHMLHYPPDGFQNCPKPFLVKQILVRYGKNSDWDPNKLVAPLTKLEKITVPTLDDINIGDVSISISVKEKAETSIEDKITEDAKKPAKKDSKRQMVTARVGHILSAPFKDMSRKKKIEIEEDRLLTPEEIEVCQAEVERAVILREERRQLESEVHQQTEDADNKRRRTAQFDDTNSSFDTSRHSKHHDEIEKVHLGDISSIDDIKNLRKIQLKHVLWQENVDYDSLKGKQAYYEAVVALWLNYKQIENNHVEHEIDAVVNARPVNSAPSVKPHKQLHRLQYNQKSSSEKPSTSKVTKSIVKLRDLPASSFAEKMSEEQLREILVYHHFDPDEYPDKGDLVYAVLCLWHAIRRGHTTKKIVKELNSRPKSLQLNAENKEVIVEDLKSPTDIHNLDPFQLRSILMKHGINPAQYKDDDELYLGVVNLWSGLTTQQSDKPKLEKKTSDNRTVAETAIAVSKWLKQSDKPNAPLALLDDITFIDENSDYEAIGGQISSDSE
ncbi:hypothetical protein CHUAL_005667 [Chamberlinius hualienensis]